MGSVERRLFGTDGIRGIANQFPMTCETALALGRAVAYQAQSGPHRHRILIGKDTRLSGYMLEMAFASGVCSMGVDALLIGPLPTPAVAFLTHNMRCDAGVIISASHNPYEDNGFKIFASDGFKLPDEREAQLEQFLEDKEIGRIRPTRSAVGKAFRIDDARGRYIVALKSVFPGDLDLSGMRIAIDCANGAAYRVAPMALEELGAEVFAHGVSPNGRNINDASGALHPQSLREAVRDHGADIGIALDGDADRLVVVDERGESVNGDAIMAIAARDMLAAGTLKNATLVTTVMSNLALDKTIAGFGGKIIRTQVGDRYVVEAMRAGGHNFGGENSGHLVYLDHSTTGDGMIAALKLLAVLRRENVKLSELASVFHPYPQSLLAVSVREKKPLDEIDEVQAEISRVEQELGDDGRVMVRYSGTEAKARVLVEGVDEVYVGRAADAIAAAIRRALG